MSRRARVTSIQALDELRAALLEFAEEARRALIIADADISRTTRFIGADLPRYWKEEVRKREQAVVKARIAFEVALNASNKKSTVEERKQLARQKERLESAKRRSEATSRWARQLDREAMMYKGRVEPLNRFAGADAPRAATTLLRMIERLEEYVTLQAPTSDAPAEDAPSRAAHRDADAPAGPSMARPLADAEATPASPLQHIHDRLPDEGDIAEAPPGAVGDLPVFALPTHQRRRLGDLCARSSLEAATTILVADTALHTPRLALHRDSPADETDSGWRLFSPEGEAPARWVRIPVLLVLRSGSPLYDLLRIRRGWTIIARSEARDEGPPVVTSIDSAWDHQGHERWSTPVRDPEEPAP